MKNNSKAILSEGLQMVCTANIIIQPIPEQKEINYHKLYISHSVIKSLGLVDGQRISLWCSERSVNVTIYPLDETDGIIFCSEKVLQHLLLPIQTLPLQLSFNKTKNTLKIGPLIAMVLYHIKDHSTFNGLRNFCNELEQFALKKHALFYIFAVNEWEDEFVSGYVRFNNEWIKTKLPFPTIIYNRIPSRKQELSTYTKKLFQTFEEKNIPFFNDHFLNKWEVHDTLTTHDYLSPYLPKTHLMDGFSSLKEMLLSHETIFIKPVNGSQGRNIYRIQLGEKGFTIDYSTFSGEVERHFPTLEELYHSLRTRLKKERFLIQEGLELLKDSNRPVDFRILCHKNEKGNWKVTSAVARVSEQNNFVSNLSKGGEQLSLQQLLEKHFNAKTIKQVKKALFELATEIAQLLSNETKGLFAEFGIDLALDHKAHIWIIEVNTKPSKRHDSPKKQLTIRPSAKSLINYCLYLYYKEERNL